MLSVEYSQKEHWVELDVSGEVSLAQVKRAYNNLTKALSKMDHGYTLIEYFRNRPHFPPETLLAIGPLMGLCYDHSRIWRAVRILSPDSPDPGLIVTHRTRWGRQVPEINVDTLEEATALAKEELSEHSQWFAEEKMC